MDMESVEGKLPDGFHDVKLFGFEIDLAHGEAVMRFGVEFGELEKEAIVKLGGLAFCSVEPPLADPQYVPLEAHWTRVIGARTTEKLLPNLESYVQLLPSGCSFYSFYLTSTNGFIHLAATTADIVIEGEGLSLNAGLDCSGAPPSSVHSPIAEG